MGLLALIGGRMGYAHTQVVIVVAMIIVVVIIIVVIIIAVVVLIVVVDGWIDGRMDMDGSKAERSDGLRALAPLLPFLSGT
jgi:hypothetical protein